MTDTATDIVDENILITRGDQKLAADMRVGSAAADLPDLDVMRQWCYPVTAIVIFRQ